MFTIILLFIIIVVSVQCEEFTLIGKRYHRDQFGRMIIDTVLDEIYGTTNHTVFEHKMAYIIKTIPSIKPVDDDDNLPLQYLSCKQTIIETNCKKADYYDCVQSPFYHCVLIDYNFRTPTSTIYFPIARCPSGKCTDIRPIVYEFTMNEVIYKLNEHYRLKITPRCLYMAKYYTNGQNHHTRYDDCHGYTLTWTYVVN